MTFRKSTIFSALLLIFVQIQLSGQPLPLIEFNVSSGMGLQNDRVCLTVTTNNFINVESVQFNLSYNASLILPICPFDYSNSALNPDIDNGNFNCNNSSNGFVNFVWFNNPTTLPNGSVLFNICFDLIGEAGNISPIYFNGQLLDIEIGQVDNNGNSVNTDNIISNVGTIMIKSNTLAAFVSKCDADANNIPDGGNATFYATAGTPPYSYTIVPGGYSGTLSTDGLRQTISNIPQGNYTLNIIDANGLNTSRNFTISNNIPLVIDSFSIKKPTCLGRNGEINIKGVSGGVSPYKYEWSNLLTGFNKISDLPINKYTLTITDFTGCKKTEIFDLNVDTLKFNLIIKDSTACAGVKTGIISIVNVKGGSPWKGGFNYKYTINSLGNPKPFLNTLDITGIGSGPNKITVFDSVGCAIDRIINMPFKKVVRIDTVEFKNVSCFGKMDGSVRLRAAPGTGYGYTPSLNILDSGNQGGTFIASNMGPDTYMVTARDASGCTATLTFTIKEPTQILLNEVVVQPDCVNPGSITLNPSGGNGSFVYKWNPDVGNVSIQTGLSGGTYTVTVSDANNCTASTSMTLNVQGALNIIPEIQKQISCTDKNDAVLSIKINSGNGPFTTVWTNESGAVISNMATVTNIGPGIYTVVVSDKNGCSNSATNIVVTNPPAITIVTTTTNAPCYDENGKIEVTVSGNASGFKYEWRLKGNVTVIDSDNILNAKAGTYIVKATSPSGCEVENEVIITAPIEIIFPDPQTRNVTCFGLSTGQGAILGGPQGITYTWSSGSIGQFAINLPEGSGWVVGSLASCKSDTVFFTIGTFPPLEIDQNKTMVINPTCFGDNNGSVTIEAKGGTASGYKYTWKNGSSGPNLTNIPAGAYIVSISDSNNCVQSDTFFLTQPDKLEAFIDRVKTIELDCNNQDKGKIGLATSGGNPGIKTISWQTGVISDGGIAVGLSPGTYCATISDNFGCKDTFCYSLIASQLLRGELNPTPEPLCNGGETCISVKFLTGGTGNKYTFQLNNGIRYPIDSCVTVFAGQYFINLIDSAGCSIDTLITIGQPDPILVELGDDLEVQLGLPSAVINAFIDSPAGLDTLIWSPSIGIKCVSEDCSSIEANPSETTTYSITVTDLNGCIATDEITIKVKNIRNVYFANIFTPNRDGNNDFFQAVTGPGVEKIVSFSIYDRWGNRVFDKLDYVPDPAGSDGWDGTFGGRRLDPGVFVYFARALFLDGKIIEYSGSVTLADKVRN